MIRRNKETKIKIRVDFRFTDTHQLHDIYPFISWFEAQIAHLHNHIVPLINGCVYRQRVGCSLIEMGK